MAEIVDKVMKGGTCWFEMSISRGKQGLTFYVKADPKVEEFFAGISGGQKESVDAYGRDWTQIGPEPLIVYGLAKALQSGKYTVSSPAEPLLMPKTGLINISFLRFAGISSPDGVQFGVVGPFSKDYIKELQKTMAQEIRNLIKDYIVPVNLNLRISSTEV